MCLCVGVCVCDRVGVLCVLEGEEGGCGGGGGGDGGWVLRSVPYDSLSGTANVWRNRARVALSTYSQTDNGEDPLVSFGEPLEQVITTRTNLGKQN